MFAYHLYFDIYALAILRCRLVPSPSLSYNLQYSIYCRVNILKLLQLLKRIAFDVHILLTSHVCTRQFRPKSARGFESLAGVEIFHC